MGPRVILIEFDYGAGYVANHGPRLWSSEIAERSINRFQEAHTSGTKIGDLVGVCKSSNNFWTHCVHVGLSTYDAKRCKFRLKRINLVFWWY